ENVDYKSAAMTEPLACTHHGVAKTDIHDGDLVIVIGPGPIGLFTAQVAKSRGGKVMISGLTNDQVRLDKAEELSIEYVVNTQEQYVKEIVNSLTDGYIADVLFECSAAVPAATQGLELLRKKGQ